MPIICSGCGKKIIKYPIKDKQGNIIWKNMFKMDMISVLLVLVIAAMVTGYKLDMKTCEEMIYNPCGYCNATNCCLHLQRQAMGWGEDVKFPGLQEMEFNITVTK